MTPARRGTLALLLEVAATPTPGNVDREREYPDLRFEQFLAGATGALGGLEAAASGAPVGEAFETAVAGMAERSGGNTQFGGLLLLVPLVRAAALTDGDGVDRGEAVAAVEATTVDDAAAFYRAFDHVDVFVEDPPEGMDALDVRRGSDAVPAVRDRGIALRDVMAASAPRDGVAAEWVGGFDRTFRAADLIERDDGPVGDRAARAFLALLAAEPDSLVAGRRSPAVARRVSERAADVRDGDADREAAVAFADDLVERGINPGTTADLLAAGLFVALERGVEVGP